jgi:hypothetical protein
MEFLDIRTLKTASLVNRDFKYGADRLIWKSFYICVDAHNIVSCNRELRRIQKGCRIACTGIRPQRIRKFTLTFYEFYSVDPHLAGEFERRILEMIFATLQLLNGLRQLELDLACTSSRTTSFMSDLIRGPFPFQLERFTLNKRAHHEMCFLSEFLLPQKRITTLSINWGAFIFGASPPPPRPRPLRVLNSGEWHLLKNRPITHLFAALVHPDEVFDLFGSLSQSTATLQLLWFRAPLFLPSDAFFQFAADPIAATVVSNLQYLVLETIQGDIRVLSLFSNLEELVMDMRPGQSQVPLDMDAVESDFFQSSKSCPRLRKAVLFFYNRESGFVMRFYWRMGAEEDWELVREDVDSRDDDVRAPLRRRWYRFPAMVCFARPCALSFTHVA